MWGLCAGNKRADQSPNGEERNAKAMPANPPRPRLEEERHEYWRPSGIYRRSLHDARLTLRLVSEGQCSGRTDTLTFPVWIRASRKG
jgi:hypothetical protein